MGNIIVVFFFYGMMLAFVLAVVYFVIKMAVRNGIKEAYRDIKGKDNIEEYWKTF